MTPAEKVVRNAILHEREEYDMAKAAGERTKAIMPIVMRRLKISSDLYWRAARLANEWERERLYSRLND